MNKHQAVSAAIQAAREGREVSVFGHTAPLNNLNYNSRSTGEPMVDPANRSGSYSPSGNLNNLKAQPEKKRGGVPRIKLFTDEALKKAISWGVEEWLIQVSIRDYGEYVVKGHINRIHQLPDAYFKPQYGTILEQKGKFFNMEMGKLKKAKEKRAV